MSYRNDYDAACARLEVLEVEHAKLVAENTRLRGTGPPPVTQTVEKPAFSRIAVAALCAFGSLALAFVAFAIAAA